jgi:hypothetical protein
VLRKQKGTDGTTLAATQTVNRYLAEAKAHPAYFLWKVAQIAGLPPRVEWTPGNRRQSRSQAGLVDHARVQPA